MYWTRKYKYKSAEVDRFVCVAPIKKAHYKNIKESRQTVTTIALATQGHLSISATGRDDNFKAINWTADRHYGETIIYKEFIKLGLTAHARAL